jgi:PAS domain S-box-containing protein
MDIVEDFRCACGKLLFRGMILSGAIEVKCRSCKRIETIESFSGSIRDTERYVLTLNAQENLLRFSASAPAILGYSRDELLKKSVSDIIVMLSPEFYASLWEALSSKGPTIFLFQSLQRHRDRSLTPIEVEAQYLSGAEGHGAVIFTVRKKSAARLTTAISSTA